MSQGCADCHARLQMTDCTPYRDAAWPVTASRIDGLRMVGIPDTALTNACDRHGSRDFAPS